MNSFTFKDLAEEWLVSQKKFIKESTYCTYAVQLKKSSYSLIRKHRLCHDNIGYSESEIVKLV